MKPVYNDDGSLKGYLLREKTEKPKEVDPKLAELLEKYTESKEDKVLRQIKEILKGTNIKMDVKK